MNKFTGVVGYYEEEHKKFLTITYKDVVVKARIPLHIWQAHNIEMTEWYIQTLTKELQRKLIKECLMKGYNGDSESQPVSESHVADGGSGMETLAPTDTDLPDVKEAT